MLTGTAATLRIEAILALPKLAVVGLLLLLPALLLPCVSVAPLGRSEIPGTGILVPYPAKWRRAVPDSACWPSSGQAIEPAWEAARFGGPAGPMVRFLVIPLEDYARGRWARALPDWQDWTQRHLLTSLVVRFGFVLNGSLLRMRSTLFLGDMAVELSGPRPDGQWGAVVARLDGARLLAFELAASSRASFHRFEPTWRRMVRRAERLTLPDSESGAEGLTCASPPVAAAAGRSESR